MSYGRQLLPGSFGHALSYLIDNEMDLGRFAARFKNDETGDRRAGLRSGGMAEGGAGRLFAGAQ